MSAAGDEERRVAFLTQSVQSDVAADAAVQADVDAVVQQTADLEFEHVVGQAVGRDAEAEHSAQERQRLEDR